jgi:type VI secretion system secreted protein Hcp
MPIYLKLGAIKGGVTESGHADWIDCGSLQFGTGRGIEMVTGTSTSRSASAPSISEITLSKVYDKSSTNLFYEAVVGKGVEAKIHFLRSQGDKLENYLEVTLTDAMVSSYSVSSGGDVPSESISLNFTKIELRHMPTKTDGTLDSAVTAGYDLSTGSKI